MRSFCQLQLVQLVTARVVEGNAVCYVYIPDELKCSQPKEGKEDVIIEVSNYIATR